MCVELITPDGNWSSYPPHRHDDSPECPVNNEEIYYFRIGRRRQQRLLGRGFRHASHVHARRLDRRQRGRSTTAMCSACHAAITGRASPHPGYPMYYLNVLAGPGGERSMAFCDDPTHHWVRDTWADMATDPRCPMTTKDGRTA